MTNVPSPARSRVTGARICTILGFVFAALAVLPLSPLIFGIVGVVLGIVGAVMGDKPLGWYAAAAAVVGTVIGTLIGVAIISS